MLVIIHVMMLFTHRVCTCDPIQYKSSQWCGNNFRVTGQMSFLC